MKFRVVLAVVAALLPVAVCADNMLANGSFESGLSSWARDPAYSAAVQSSGWNGITALDGQKFLVISGPATVGCTYARVVTQTLSAPFGAGIPNDNFLVYLYALTYLHTTDSRHVSYAVTVEPGYGSMNSAFYGAAHDEWVLAQTSGYYYSKDPYDPAAPAKPLKVSVELRDSLQAGEYLAVDAVTLYYGGGGTAEP